MPHIEHDGTDDEQDRYVNKTDREANRERAADVAAAKAAREADAARPRPVPESSGIAIPIIPRTTTTEGSAMTETSFADMPAAWLPHEEDNLAFDLDAATDHALTAADRAASAKADLLQSRKATADGAAWLRECAREKLSETIEAAKAALVELDRPIIEVT